MAKVDSLDQKYKILSTVSIIKKIIFYFVILETLGSIWLSEFVWFKIVVISSVVLNCFAIIAFEALNHYLEQLRIVNAIENGFQKSIDSNVETTEYYNNESKKGLEKFTLNIFESVFFTKKIFEYGLIIKYLSYLVFFVVFVVGLSVANLDIALIICDVVFSCGIVYELFKTILFHHEIRRIFHSFDTVFISHNQTKQKEWLLALSFQYEKAKSNVGLSLNSSLFRLMNPSLTKEWNEYLNRIIKH